MKHGLISSRKGGKVMSMVSVCVVVLGWLICKVVTAVAQQKRPVETVLDGSNKEFDSYCKNVTPGEGRLLAWHQATSCAWLCF
jgi:hypothetical protein